MNLKGSISAHNVLLILLFGFINSVQSQPNFNSGNCTTNPCSNGGTCVQLGLLYTCRCPGSSFEEANCDTDNPCRSNPCLNGGSCNPTTTSYRCSCPSAYTSTNCENKKWSHYSCYSKPSKCKDGYHCYRRCDGVNDCPDRSDEEDCHKSGTSYFSYSWGFSFIPIMIFIIICSTIYRRRRLSAMRNGQSGPHTACAFGTGAPPATGRYPCGTMPAAAYPRQETPGFIPSGLNAAPPAYHNAQYGPKPPGYTYDNASYTPTQNDGSNTGTPYPPPPAGSFAPAGTTPYPPAPPLGGVGGGPDVVSPPSYEQATKPQ